MDGTHSGDGRGRRAAQSLRDDTAFQVALGILATRAGMDLDVAERSLRDAAPHAGVNPRDLARAALEANGHDRDDQ